MFSKIIFLVSFMFALNGFTQTSIPLERGDKNIRVNGFHGDISLKGNPKSKNFILTIAKKMDKNAPSFAQDAAENWSVSWKKSNGTILISVSPTQEKGDWKLYMQKGGIPDFDIVLTGPPMPIEFIWRKGKVNIENWNSKASVHSLDSQVFVQGGEGTLDLTQQKGSIKVTGHSGSKTIESYNGRVELLENKGSVRLTNFSGRSTVTKGEGSVHLVTHSGQSQFSQFEGKVDFENDRSRLVFDKHNGDIVGKSGQGDVSVSLVGESNVRVRSEEGRVQIKAPGSGAFVNVGSESGPLDLPSYFKLTRYATIKVSQGRLRGGKKGNIFVRTVSGAVSIR